MVASRTTRQDYPAQKARGAVIVLRKPWQRVVFFGGSVGCVLVALVAPLMR
jgi:hypothetical protein